MKKNVLITGSISGIGYGIAEGFIKNGFNVFLHGMIEETEGKQIADKMSSKYNVGVHYKKLDLKKKDAIKSLIEGAEKDLGGIDILINNAGIQKVSRVENFNDNDWEDIISVNLSAAFYTSKYVLPEMRKRNYGRIINIASVHGLVASENKAAYVAAKHGILGMTKVIALENADMNITCNAICPGWVDTPLVRAQIENIAQQESIDINKAEERLLSEKHPMKRFVDVNEIMKASLYICDTQSMTGTSFVIDCGWTAR